MYIKFHIHCDNKCTVIDRRKGLWTVSVVVWTCSRSRYLCIIASIRTKHEGCSKSKWCFGLLSLSYNKLLPQYSSSYSIVLWVAKICTAIKRIPPLIAFFKEKKLQIVIDHQFCKVVWSNTQNESETVMHLLKNGHINEENSICQPSTNELLKNSMKNFYNFLVYPFKLNLRH